MLSLFADTKMKYDDQDTFEDTNVKYDEGKESILSLISKMEDLPLFYKTTYWKSNKKKSVVKVDVDQKIDDLCNIKSHQDISAKIIKRHFWYHIASLVGVIMYATIFNYDDCRMFLTHQSELDQLIHEMPSNSTLRGKPLENACIGGTRLLLLSEVFSSALIPKYAWRLAFTYRYDVLGLT